MFSERVRGGALRAWLLAATSGAAVLQLAGVSWWKVALSAAACGILCLCIMVLTEGECSGNAVYCCLQFGFLVIASVAVLNWSADCWPEGDSWPGVYLALILLAGASAWNGAEQGSRSGAVLWILAAVLYAVMLTTLVPDIQADNLLAEGKGEGWLIFVGLIPAVATFLPREGFRTYKWSVVWIAVFAAAVAAVTGGVLGMKGLNETDQPFYHVCKSVRLFGSSQRLESVASVVMTLGLFSLLSLFLNCAGQLAERVKAGWGRKGVLVICILAPILSRIMPGISPVWMSFGALFLWGVLPLVTIREINGKIVKKTENNT